jgi:hypothetical protein
MARPESINADRKDRRLSAFLQDQIPVLCVEPDGETHTKRTPPAAVVAGSFNPLHEGHCLLAQVAEDLLGGRAAFELSITNADKPPLAAEEVRQRLSQFRGRGEIWLTRAPTFLEKSALFPGVVFVVGADTAARILLPRYYGSSEGARTTAFEKLRRQGCRFLVAGRVDVRGRFLGLEDLTIPGPYRDLFAGIPENVFRLDVSSTRLRQQSSARS